MRAQALYTSAPSAFAISSESIPSALDLLRIAVRAQNGSRAFARVSLSTPHGSEFSSFSLCRRISLPISPAMLNVVALPGIKFFEASDSKSSVFFETRFQQNP